MCGSSSVVDRPDRISSCLSGVKLGALYIDGTTVQRRDADSRQACGTVRFTGSGCVRHGADRAVAGHSVILVWRPTACRCPVATKRRTPDRRRLSAGPGLLSVAGLARRDSMVRIQNARPFWLATDGRALWSDRCGVCHVVGSRVRRLAFQSGRLTAAGAAGGQAKNSWIRKRQSRARMGCHVLQRIRTAGSRSTETCVLPAPGRVLLR